MKTREVTHEQLAAAMNEWMRRYTDHPDQFAREWYTVQTYLTEQAAGKTPSYGDSTATYLERLLDETAEQARI